jgi:C4-dicarboxylate-specific signal transduction histidine kinase
METLSLITIILLTTVIAGLVLALLKEKRLKEQFERELESFRGQSEEQIYGRSKFSELGLMSAGITHEISNPLSIILGRVTQLMRRHPSEEDLKKGLQQIKENTERIGKIIANVRSYIYRNEAEVDDFISLREIIDSVMMFYGQRLKNHGIELRLKNIDKMYVSGHRGQYEQAILNLISNAFDAVDHLQEKWIEISAHKEGDKVQIYVEDSGTGIPVEVREKIMDPFFTTKHGKGTGLGLSLVKGVARKHGGDLRYVEAHHTTFLLELPKSSSVVSYH